MKRDMEVEVFQIRRTDGSKEERVDWLMRQFVDETIKKVALGKIDKLEAKRLLMERGVPVKVQTKVLYGHNWV